MGNCCRKTVLQANSSDPRQYRLRVYEKKADKNYYSDLNVCVSAEVFGEIDKQIFTFYHDGSIYCNHFPILDLGKKALLHDIRQRARNRRTLMARKPAWGCTKHYIGVF